VFGDQSLRSETPEAWMLREFVLRSLIMLDFQSRFEESFSSTITVDF
jgi:hypothetical protein